MPYFAENFKRQKTLNAMNKQSLYMPVNRVIKTPMACALVSTVFAPSANRRRLFISRL